MNELEIARWMQRNNISEFYRKTSYDGRFGGRKVQIDIFDGTIVANPAHRYYATATAEDGTTGTGNNGATVDEALDNLSAHLSKLGPQRK